MFSLVCKWSVLRFIISIRVFSLDGALRKNKLSSNSAEHGGSHIEMEGQTSAVCPGIEHGTKAWEAGAG